jgi:hypothetical protein
VPLKLNSFKLIDEGLDTFRHMGDFADVMLELKGESVFSIEGVHLLVKG